MSIDRSKKLVPFNEEQNIVFICETIQPYVRSKRVRQIEEKKAKKSLRSKSEKDKYLEERHFFFALFLSPLLQTEQFQTGFMRRKKNIFQFHLEFKKGPVHFKGTHQTRQHLHSQIIYL